MTYLLCLILSLICAGCASQEIYDPLRLANHQTLLLNEGAFSRVSNGMSIDEVHQAMGQKIVIGYTRIDGVSDNASKLAGEKSAVSTYQPLTILNPYKSEEIKGSHDVFMVEYYVTKVEQPGGLISDKELMPFIFKNNILVGRDWPYLKSLRLKP